MQIVVSMIYRSSIKRDWIIVENIVHQKLYSGKNLLRKQGNVKECRPICMTNWLTDCSCAEWLTDWLTDQPTNQPPTDCRPTDNRLTDWPTNWPINQLTDLIVCSRSTIDTYYSFSGTYLFVKCMVILNAWDMIKVYIRWLLGSLRVPLAL